MIELWDICGCRIVESASFSLFLFPYVSYFGVDYFFSLLNDIIDYLEKLLFTYISIDLLRFFISRYLLQFSNLSASCKCVGFFTVLGTIYYILMISSSFLEFFSGLVFPLLFLNRLRKLVLIYFEDWLLYFLVKLIFGLKVHSSSMAYCSSFFLFSIYSSYFLNLLTCLIACLYFSSPISSIFSFDILTVLSITLLLYFYLLFELDSKTLEVICE